MKSLINKKNLFILTILGLFLIAGNALSVKAQVQDGDISPDSISVKLSSTLPKPGETVSVSLLSYSTDLDRATITWLINSKVITSGVGQKTFSFKVGTQGKDTVLTVIVETQGGGRFEKEISINPGSVDILWQATNSYTPPFYRGKPLPLRTSKIRAVAVPSLITSDGSSLPKEDIVYNWTFNGDPQLESSGIAKNFIELILDYTDVDGTIGVKVSSVENPGLATDSAVRFSTYLPNIVFYEDKPLEGIDYTKAIVDSYDLKNDEVRILAEPYFFSVNGRNKNDLSLTWLVGYKEVSLNSFDKGEITLRAPKDAIGKSDVSIKAEHKQLFLQQKGASFTINFGNKK